VALECAHAIFILRCAIAIGEDSSRLGILSRGPPLSLFDMLLAIGGGSFVVRPLRWFFCLLGCGSFHFVPFVSSFFQVFWFICDWQGFINKKAVSITSDKLNLN